jgi:murein DD-endopeptidase MepM/ murein hydrolase activator NlpD
MGNHRVEHDTSCSPAGPESSGGKRRAVKSSARGRQIKGLPSAPVLMGVAALVVTVAGAVTASDAGVIPTAADQSETKTTQQVNAMSGTSAVSSVLASRERETQVSRDSSREAQAEAADEKLQSAVEQQAQQRNAELAGLAVAAEKQAQKIKENNWVLPVSGYHITNTWGMSRSYYSSGYHTGLDFAVAQGTPIHAIASGTISELRYDGSYGNLTVMTLDDGTEIYYGHQLSYASGLSVGQRVTQGDVIGYVGTTGNSTGPHVHIEVRPGGGDDVDPYPAFVVHGVTP